MKKVLLIMAAALMTMTQCRKQETVPATPSANTIKMTITAGPGAKTNIDDNGAITWTSGDKLYVSDGAKWLGSLTLNSAPGNASGTFTGTIQGIGDGEKTCHFFYLGHDNGMTGATVGENTDVSISFTSQDGTRGDALKYHLGHGSAEVTVSGGAATGAVAMRTEIAMAHLNFTTDGTSAYTGSVTMDVSNTMTVSPAGNFSGSGNGIAIGNGDGERGDRYVTLIPTEATNVSFSGCATGSMTFGHGIQANNLYGMANGIDVTLTATHEYVDLGLTSGLLWATCNMGASSPENYGWYFMWGSTTNGGDLVCGWTNCPGNGRNSSYNATEIAAWNNSNLTNDVLNSGVDAARANWGGNWRMPTADDFNELKNNTTRTWKDANAPIEIGEQTVSMPVAGYYCVSKKSGYTDKYIFFPAAGYRDGAILREAGSIGRYWSSSLSTSNPSHGRDLNFSSDNGFYRSTHNRCYGFAVRPVCPSQN